MAVSLALLGKKVILVGLDIRKPGLNKLFHLSHKEKGITQYLVAPKSTDLHALIQPSGISSNLSVLGGLIPPNPTELLARQSLEDTISTLRKEYDYIVLDTAPIGMVTDTLILSRVADASIYVCRADYTHKTDYQLINELQGASSSPQLMHSSQRDRYEEEKIRLLLRLRQVWQDTMDTARNMDTVR